MRYCPRHTHTNLMYHRASLSRINLTALCLPVNAVSLPPHHSRGSQHLLTLKALRRSGSYCCGSILSSPSSSSSSSSSLLPLDDVSSCTEPVSCVSSSGLCNANDAASISTYGHELMVFAAPGSLWLLDHPDNFV